jgi:hypothetical protein
VVSGFRRAAGDFWESSALAVKVRCSIKCFVARPLEIPSAPEAEPLDELSDDLIIAQESRAHAPQPRVHVDIDPRTVVIAGDAETRASDPGPQPPVRSLAPFTFAAEPTLVIKNRRSTHPQGSSRPPAAGSRPPVLSRRDQRLVIAIMCLVTALLAFSLGGALALLLARRQAPPAQAAEPAQPVQHRR